VRLRFATDWRAQAEHGGFYQALASGAYARRGLNVEIIQGGPGVNVPQLLASGAVELGMGSNSFIPMNLVAEGAPVKAVAAFFQKDPQVLIAHPDPALETIADLADRPFLLATASRDAFWVWLKAKYGFTDDQVRTYNFNPAPFLADERAVQQGYLTPMRAIPPTPPWFWPPMPSPATTPLPCAASSPPRPRAGATISRGMARRPGTGPPTP